MNYKRKYKQDVLKELTPNDKYDAIASKLDLTPPKKNVKMKKNVLLVSSLACLSIVIGFGAYFLLNDNPTTYSSNSVIKMKLNPEITFVVDEENKVVTATGENQEGQMIIVNENLIGLDLNEAIKIVLTIENETGYLISGNATINDNNISFSISTDDQEAIESIKDNISKTVSDVCKQLNVTHNALVYETSKYFDELKQEVLALNPELTSQEVEMMSFDEIYEIIKVNYEQQAKICSVELAKLYQQAKDYEFKIAESEFTVNMIKDLKPIQASLLEGVFALREVAVDNLKTGIEAIQQARYNHFVKEDSQYFLANQKLLEYKAEVIKHKNELANIKDIESEEYKHILEALNQREKLLDDAMISLENAKLSAEEFLTSMEENITSLIDSVNEFTNQIVEALSVDLETELNNKAVELDSFLNETKTTLFTNFETKYAEDIASYKQQLQEYKESLKSQNA